RLAGNSAARLAVGANQRADPGLEPGVEVALEEVVRLHDVHVAVDEPKSILHGGPPRKRADVGAYRTAIYSAPWISACSSSRPGAASISRTRSAKCSTSRTAPRRGGSTSCG